MEIELLKKTAWDRYKDFSKNSNNLLKETNQNILGNIGYYQLEYERGRRIENTTLEYLSKAIKEQFFDKPIKYLKVVDIACGLPFLEEILYKVYDLTEFTLVDLFSNSCYDEYLSILKSSCPNINIKYLCLDVEEFCNSFTAEKFDIIISSINDGNLERFKNIMADKTLIIYDYTQWAFCTKQV